MPAIGFTFPRTHRLSGKTTFAAVYNARVRESRGPLTVYAKPNGRSHSRMGLSVSRHVGAAPHRNRIKRLLRESFRLSQHDLPRGYDWIVVVRRHEPMTLEEYQRFMKEMTAKLERTWETRR